MVEFSSEIRYVFRNHAVLFQIGKATREMMRQNDGGKPLTSGAGGGGPWGRDALAGWGRLVADSLPTRWWMWLLLLVVLFWSRRKRWLMLCGIVAMAASPGPPGAPPTGEVAIVGGCEAGAELNPPPPTPDSIIIMAEADCGGLAPLVPTFRGRGTATN